MNVYTVFHGNKGVTKENKPFLGILKEFELDP